MNNCGCDFNSIELPIGPKGDPGTNGTNAQNGRDGIVLLVNDTSTTSTTGTALEIVKSYTLPANSLATNGDMLKLETYVTVNAENYSAGTLTIGGYSVLFSGLGASAEIANRTIFNITRISSTQITLEVEQWNILPFNTVSNATFKKLNVGTFDFTSTINIQLKITDTVATNGSASLFRITKYLI